MGLRYALREVREHGSDRTWWRKRFLSRVLARYYARRDRNVTPVMEEDWDTLVVLDACRYDLFAEVLDENPLPGELERRESLASETPGFLAANFEGGTFHDTVYVAGNPYVTTELDRERFHAVDEVWRDGWDDDVGTVLPETMADRTMRAVEEYPHKRVVSHFLQPHAPFVGDERLPGQETFAVRDRALGDEDATRSRRTPFERLDAGEVTRDEVWRAYRSNLERAFPAVEGLIDQLEGRTVITTDHGNALGERASPFPVRVYGHPAGILIPELTEVPWFVHSEGERRDVVAEVPEHSDGSVDEETADRLRQLGYAE